jgi:hypothetical protein
MDSKRPESQARAFEARSERPRTNFRPRSIPGFRLKRLVGRRPRAHDRADRSARDHALRLGASRLRASPHERLTEFGESIG